MAFLFPMRISVPILSIFFFELSNLSQIQVCKIIWSLNLSFFVPPTAAQKPGFSCRREGWQLKAVVRLINRCIFSIVELDPLLLPLLAPLLTHLKQQQIFLKSNFHLCNSSRLHIYRSVWFRRMEQAPYT